jgi:ATP adenylyltransferase|tara:strand:+ start:1623 stop:2198 length:576 start_codon:yes stop_codon:yes gene_type:complete
MSHGIKSEHLDVADFHPVSLGSRFVKYLWSPWRLKYVVSANRSRDCIFCEVLTENSESTLSLYQGETCFIQLNLYPYSPGHLMVVPKRHLPSLTSATVQERIEIITLTALAEVALTEVYAPQGLNVGINLGSAGGAGVVDHIHVHVVPRWSGDTNFMTVIGDTRVLPEELEQTAAKLRPVFKRLVVSEKKS